jgi:hypothetical protein
MRLRSHHIILTAISLILLAFAGAAVTYLRSARFQERARAALFARIRQATGLQLSMEQFSLDILRGRFAIGRLELKSARGFALAIDEASGSFRLTALWRPKIELGELNLTRLHMSIVPQPGGAPWSLEPVIRRSLSVAARKTTVRDSWVQYDNRRIPLNLTLDALDCNIQYQPSPQSYVVQLAYKNSTLLWLGRKFVYDLDARLGVLPTGLEIVEFKLREDKSRFSGSGRLSNWNSPALQLRAVGTIAGENAVLLTPDIKDARGEVNVITDLSADAHRYHLAGRFSGETVSYRTSVTHSLTGLFEIQNDVLSLRDVRGGVGDGSFRLDGEVQLKVSNKPPNRIRISAQNVVIRDCSGLLDLRSLALENSVDAEVVLEWRRGQQDLSAEGSVNLHGIPDAAPGAQTRTALQGTTEFYYRKDAWYVKNASLTSPGTRVEVTQGDPKQARIKVETDRPAEIFRMLRGFSSSLDTMFSARPDWMWISGTYHLDGAIFLHLPEAINYEGRAAVENGRWRNYGVDSLSGMASWSGSTLQLHSMKLQKGQQTAKGEFWIRTAQDDADPDLSFTGALDQISLGSLGEFGLDLDTQISGVLSSQRISVTYERGEIQGNGRLKVEAGSLGGQSFDSLSAAIQVKDKKLNIADGQIKRGSAVVGANGLIDLGTRQMNLKASLKELPLAEITQVKASGLAVDGRVTASGEISGTPEQPEIKAGKVHIDGLRYAGWDLGAGDATLELHNKVLRARFDIKSELGSLHCDDASFVTEPGYPGKATLEFSNWNIKKIIANNVSEIINDLSMELRGKLVIEGPFADSSKLTYHDGVMYGASFEINRYKFNNEGPIQFSGDASKVVVEKAVLAGDGSRLVVDSGEIPFGSDAPLKLHVNGKLNLVSLDHLSYFPKVGISGSATIDDVSISGSREAPEVIGHMTLEGARLNYGDLLPLSDLRGNIVFSRDSIVFKGISGKIASGAIQIDGSAAVQNNTLSNIALQGSLRNARLKYPKDFVSTIDAELTLNGGPESLALTGDVTVLRAEYLRDFNLLEQIIGGSSGSSGASAADSLYGSITLNIPVHSRDGLYLDNELTRVQGGMDLTLRGTIGEPYVTGRVFATEGSIFFRGNRFDIVNGSIDFVDRNRINPVLNIRAEADVRSYRVRLDVNGDLEHLHSHGLTVTSDPPLSEVDILALLVTGKSEDPGATGIENPRRQAEMTGLSAASILSEEMTSVVGKRVERIFGLSTFRVDPFLAGAENDPTARITISERLSPDLSITFSRNLSTSQEQIVLIEYDVNKNLSIIATRDENGQYGIDFRFRKRLR